MENKKMHISICNGDYFTPVEQFKRVLKMISPEEIKSAVVKANQTIDIDAPVEEWNLQLFTDDTQISVFDATAGYYGDSPIGKTLKILKLAGFEVSCDEITNCKEDIYLVKSDKK